MFWTIISCLRQLLIFLTDVYSISHGQQINKSHKKTKLASIVVKSSWLTVTVGKTFTREFYLSWQSDKISSRQYEAVLHVFNSQNKASELELKPVEASQYNWQGKFKNPKS